MKPEISELLKISDFYGQDKDYVIAGGGNTSFKDDSTIWIKASGTRLAGLTEEGLVALDREKLQIISKKKYSEEPVEREEEVKQDLASAILESDRTKRPSVETSLHEIIGYAYVVHLHPAIINGVLCSRNARNLVTQMFGDTALFIPYTDPGYTLFIRLKSDILKYREKYKSDPHIIFLENHGVFVSADYRQEIQGLYDEIVNKVKEIIDPRINSEQLPYNPVLNKALPVMRMLLSDEKLKIIRHRNNELIAQFYKSQGEFQKISHPLTPDIIVYCKSRYMFIEQSSTAERIIESFRSQLERFVHEFNFRPKVIIIKDMGVFAIENDYSSAETVLDVYEDLLRICHFTAFCGGTKLLTPDQIDFIDNWEVENYRRKVAVEETQGNNLYNKVAVVTGGAQGFGEGIAESLFTRNINIVVADINDEAGVAFCSRLNKRNSTNHAVFVRTDVSDPGSVKDLISGTVSEFGGIDIMISNAGILKAGSLEEMGPEDFSRITEINYNGYYHCAMYASAIMKLQNREKPDYFMDIIQINSKSGLRGSNRNFAYAGAKFGGIGLTQSFALELAPYKIKVNSICPGNFYEGPLWSDPKTGLFVQYLRTGKVPGAKTIDDVRDFYEKQVPLKRGCRLNDLMKAIYYVMDQEYETGQAIPVTGGQVMLG
jgi:rhamnose utilization protein RhaD (predicted bifunctional aldolase and dehydrogenase)/NAD(P)-dependent dehydrogenase (short-subunit alcohol dehydrogenase family)